MMALLAGVVGSVVLVLLMSALMYLVDIMMGHAINPIREENNVSGLRALKSKMASIGWMTYTTSYLRADYCPKCLHYWTRESARRGVCEYCGHHKCERAVGKVKVRSGEYLFIPCRPAEPEEVKGYEQRYI